MRLFEFNHDLISNYMLVGVLASFMMTVAWVVHLKYKNASIADIPWCFGNIIFFAAMLKLNDTCSTAHLVMLAMITLWSARLGIYLTRRIFQDPYNEDGRFKKIRSDLKSHEGLWFFFMFQFQAALQIVLCTSYLLCAMDSNLQMGLWQYLALCLFLFSFAMQWLADSQLARFAKENRGKNNVCDTGLWKYSRHPNYFFEFCIWLSFAIFAINSPNGAYAFISPALIYFVLTQLSGVKLSEEVSLAKRGDIYRDYMNRTSSFFLLPPKNSKTKSET